MPITAQEIKTKTKINTSTRIALTFMILTGFVLIGSVLFSAAYIGLSNKFKKTSTTATANTQNQDQTFETEN